MNGNTPVPPVPSDKKGIPVLGWVGIGCGTILIIVIVVVSLMIGWCKRTVGDLSEFKRNPEKAAAEMMVRLNPDLKMVTQDEARGEMTIRTKDGKEITMSYKDVAEGRFLLKDADGNIAEFGGIDLSKLPAWVPRVPDVKTATAMFRNEETGKGSGLYSATTTKSAAELGEFFKAEAEKLKATSSNSSSTVVDGVESRTLGFEGAGKKLNIVITSKPGADTQVTVSYEEEK
jgi:hypothetical protein